MGYFIYSISKNRIKRTKRKKSQKIGAKKLKGVERISFIPCQDRKASPKLQWESVSLSSEPVFDELSVHFLKWSYGVILKTLLQNRLNFTIKLKKIQNTSW